MKSLSAILVLTTTLVMLLSFCNYGVAQKKTLHIYLANCDSIYYFEGENFEEKKLVQSSLKDSIFKYELLNSINITHKVLLKPMTDLCPGEDGIGPILLSWIDRLKQKGVEFSVSVTDSTENNFFDAMSLKEEVLSHKAWVTMAPPPAPPSPPPLSSLIGKNKKALTILVTGENKFYYYNGSNCSALNMVDLRALKQTIRTRVKTTKREDIIIVLKSTQEATFRSILDILDEIVESGTPKYHYAEEDITESELKCIKNYKTK